MKNTKNSKIKHWINALIISLVPFLGTYFGVHEYTYRGASNALFLSFALTLAFICMMAVIRTGTFDIFNYSFLRLFESFKPSNPRSFESAYDYKEKKAVERSKEKMYVWPYLLFALITFILALVFTIIYENELKGTTNIVLLTNLLK